MTSTVAIFILILFMCLGDLVSIKTKAFVPSMLVVVIALAAGVWGGLLPADIIEIPGFSSSYLSYVILMFIVDMGSSISISEMKLQWRTVLIGVSSIVGIALVLFTIGNAIYGWQIVVCAAPPLSGAMVAMIEMTAAAKAIGNDTLAKLPLLIFLTQSIPAFIIIPALLKKECSRLLNNGLSTAQAIEINTSKKDTRRTLVSIVPDKYKTTAYYLLGITAVAVLSSFLSGLFGRAVSPTLFALLFGLILGELGIIERDSIKKSGSFGFLMMTSLLASVADITTSNPQEILSMLSVLIGVVMLGIIGIMIGSFIAGKFLKVSAPMSLAIGMNCFVGFPYNFMLSTEAIKACAASEEDSRYLSQKIIPTMIIGGFTTVTIGSVLFASIMKNLL